MKSLNLLPAIRNNVIVPSPEPGISFGNYEVCLP